MSISTTISSNSYSPYISWPKHHLQNQKASLKEKINGSYAFTAANQSCDEQYNKLFLDLFREMRGGDRIVDESSWTLANSLCDERISVRKEQVIYEPEEANRIEVSYHPTEEFKKELRNLLELHDGLSDQFLEALQDNQKKLKDTLDLKARDTYCSIPLLSRVFPRFYETLQGIFSDLLAVEYLDEQVVLKLNLMEPRLWEQALTAGHRQKQRDDQLAIEHEKSWASDKNNLLISAGISGATGNPIFLVAQTLRNIANAIARNTDPEREDVLTQALPLVTNTASAAINGITKELAVRLALDLADLASDRKDGDFAISMSKALITGCVHGDEERYIKEILSAVLSEASSNVSSETLVGAALKHPDVHGLFVDHFLEKQRPKPQELEESKTDEIERSIEREQELIAREEHEKAIEQQKARELEAQKQYEQELAEYNKKLEEHYERERTLNALVEERNEKQAGVMSAMWYLTDKVEKYQDNYKKDKYYSKLKQAVKNVNRNFAERDAVDNRINAFLGNPTTVSTPPMKIPKRASNWEKTKLWIDRNLEISINVSTTKPLYNTKTPNVSDGPIDRSPPTLPEKPKPIEFSFQDVQKFQEQRILETNMAYKTQNAIQPQQTQYSPNIGQWGQGVARNVQRPPASAWVAIQSGIRPSEYKVHGMKQYPNIDRTQSKIPTWLRNFASGGEPLDPQERINQNTQILVAHTKAAAKTFGSIADELRSFGCINAKFDQGKVTLRFDREISNKIEEMVSQHLPNMDHVKNFRYVEFTAGLANDVVMQAFMMPFFQAQKAKPLLDRVLVRPQGVGRQLQFLKKLNQPVYHSGIGNPFSEMVAVHPKLSKRTIQTFKQVNRSKNYQVVIWSENGAVRTAPIGEMSHAGTFHDRGGISKAGRALDKHGQRIDTVFPKAVGSIHEKNIQGQKVLDEILNHPDKKICFKKMRSLKYQDCIDIKLPDGRGARFSRDGKEFITFLEPNK